MTKSLRLGIAVLVGLVMSGCSEALSPTSDVDEARLWALLRDAPMGDGRVCAAVVLDEKPRHEESAVSRCRFWAQRFAEHLAANGLGSIGATHLESPAFWQWVRATKIRIADCKAAVGGLAPNADAATRRVHAEQRAACETMRDLTQPLQDPDV